MFEEAIRELEEQMSCSICHDIYSDPKRLQCFHHAYCRKCLVNLVVRDQQGDLSLTCPICHQATLVPAIGVTGLEPALQISRFLHIRNYLVNGYKKLYAPGDPDPSQCQATGRGLETAVVGEKSTAVLQIFNFNSEPCSHPIRSLKCELVSEITGSDVMDITVSEVMGNVERRGQKQYEIGYCPTVKGKHQFNMKVEGQHIRGSPFSVTVKLPVEKLGNPILTIDGLEGPCGVAVNQTEEIVVTECSGDCVSVFSHQCGKKLQSFGTQGSGPGQFYTPRGITVDSEGNILVVDAGNHGIQKFTTTGDFLTAVGTKGIGPVQFYVPSDVAFNNKVYVIDCWNNRIQVLNSDLTFYSTFGKWQGTV